MISVAVSRVYQEHSRSISSSVFHSEKRASETASQNLIPGLDQYLTLLERLGDGHGLGLQRLGKAHGTPPVGEAAATEPQGEGVQDEAESVADVEGAGKRVCVALPPAGELALDDDVEDDANGQVAQQVEDGCWRDHARDSEQRREEDVAKDASRVLAGDVVLDDGACEADQKEPVGPC